MANKLNAFEKEVKKAVDSYSVSYDSVTAWSQMETKMGTRTTGYKWWYGAITMLAILPLGVWYFSNNSSAEGQLNLNTPSKESVALVLSQTSENEEVVQSDEEVKEAKKETFTEGIKPSPVETNRAPEPSKSLAVVERDGVTENLEIPQRKKVELEEGSRLNEKEESELPELKIHLSKSKLCPNESAIGTYNHKQFAGKTIVWHLPNGRMQRGDSVLITSNTAGQYDVYAYVEHHEHIQSNTLGLEIFTTPNAQFTFNEEILDGVPVMSFSPSSSDHKLYKWRFGDGYQANGESVGHVFTQAKDYSVQLTVVGQNGCIWTSYQRVAPEKDFNLLAPTSFSPNADGLNDMWMPKALESDYFTYTLQIFDRAGSLIFETETSDQQWDGRVKGEYAQSGDAFVWKCKTKDPEGVVQHFKGSIVVMY